MTRSLCELEYLEEGGRRPSALSTSDVMVKGGLAYSNESPRRIHCGVLEDVGLLVRQADIIRNLTLNLTASGLRH